MKPYKNNEKPVREGRRKKNSMVMDIGRRQGIQPQLEDNFITQVITVTKVAYIIDRRLDTPRNSRGSWGG